ncbi:MAG: protease complex subunit PrcB family protein [Lachnospiraceae bacterium]
MKKGKTLFLLLFCFLLLLPVTGCHKQQTVSEGKKRLDYTVCEEENLPQEFRRQIEEKKKDSFFLSYTNKDYLFIAVGYGQTKQTNYGICVKQLYLGKHGVYIETGYIGDGTQDRDWDVIFEPYIVLKLPKPMDEKVIPVYRIYA